jgi:hypothetical protein
MRLKSSETVFVMIIIIKLEMCMHAIVRADSPFFMCEQEPLVSSAHF